MKLVLSVIFFCVVAIAAVSGINFIQAAANAQARLKQPVLGGSAAPCVVSTSTCANCDGEPDDPLPGPCGCGCLDTEESTPTECVYYECCCCVGKKIKRGPVKKSG